MDDVGISVDETEGVIDILRNIMGVEIAAFVKEREADLIKVSLRAKTDGNVAAIAAEFGGGGHIKAAGCTLHTDLETACNQIKEAIEESLRK